MVIDRNECLLVLNALVIMLLGSVFLFTGITALVCNSIGYGVISIIILSIMVYTLIE